MAAAAATNSASEVEETLARIRSHNGVEGVIIMNREGELARKLQPRVWRVLVSYRAASCRARIICAIDVRKQLNCLLFLSNNTDTTTGATLQTTLSEEQTAEHAAMLSQLTSRASNLVRDLDPTDELSMLRVRSRNREIMIAPDKEFILIVIQNPHIGESS